MTLNGIGGGGAAVTGPVSLNKITKPGQILVTKMTSPAMLDSMVKAAAVVTDEGGRMSHAAINCLEFGIPFVVGTREATTTLTNGDIITVDPVAGTVVRVGETA